MNSITNKHAAGIKISFLLLPVMTLFLLLITILKPECIEQWMAIGRNVSYNIMVLFGLSEVLVIATAVTSKNTSEVQFCAVLASLLLGTGIAVDAIASLVYIVSVTVVILLYKQVYGKIHHEHGLNAKLVRSVMIGLVAFAISGLILSWVKCAGFSFIISFFSLLAILYAIGGIIILLNKITLPNSIKSLIED